MDNWVYFTLDGTLIDNRLAEEKAALLILRDVLGLNLAREKHWTTIWNYTSQHFASTVCSERESKEQIWRNTLREFKPSLSKQECDESIALLRAAYLRNLGTFSEVPEVLFRLTERYRLGLVITGESHSKNVDDIPAGLGPLFKRIIHLPSEMPEVVHLPERLLTNDFRGARLGEKLLISSDYDLLSQFQNNSWVNPIWLNRITSQQSSSFRTITNLQEIL